MNDKIVENILIFVRPDQNQELGYRVLAVNEIHRHWMTDEDICIGETSIDYAIPDDMSHETLALKAVATLKKRQEKVRADAHIKVNKIEEKINSLLMITNQSFDPETKSFDEDGCMDDGIPF